MPGENLPMTAALQAQLDELFARHHPVVNRIGDVVGCRCLDRVFVVGHEDYPSHLAALVSAHVAQVREGLAEESDGRIIDALALGLCETFEDDEGFGCGPEEPPCIGHVHEAIVTLDALRPSVGGLMNALVVARQGEVIVR